jgi:tRNA(Leu) C34 or U34 (ribose-2'-O)-methylase TrmL
VAKIKAELKPRHTELKQGTTPSIILCNPKFQHNLGAVIRAASCFGIKQIWYTGDRIDLKDGERLPREERMKGYKDVELIKYALPLEQFPYGTVPVAVEIRQGAQMLTDFIHPDNAVYVFGPEDGSVPSGILRECHHIITIPSHHCLNLAAAVNVVLYDRSAKRQLTGKDPFLTTNNMLKEHRGYVEPDYNTL